VISDLDWWEEHVFVLRAEYEQAAAVLALLRTAIDVDGYDPDRRATRPTVDPHMFDLGTDVDETVRPREDVLPRSIVDVATSGGRL
jgi:hypothetical protein